MTISCMQLIFNHTFRHISVPIILIRRRSENNCPAFSSKGPFSSPVNIHMLNAKTSCRLLLFAIRHTFPSLIVPLELLIHGIRLFGTLISRVKILAGAGAFDNFFDGRLNVIPIVCGKRSHFDTKILFNVMDHALALLSAD